MEPLVERTQFEPTRVPLQPLVIETIMAEAIVGVNLDECVVLAKILTRCTRRNVNCGFVGWLPSSQTAVNFEFLMNLCVVHDKVNPV